MLEVRTFHLPGLLPAGHSLVLNPLLAVLTEIAEQPCRIVEQVKLSENQMYVAVCLLENFPSYATLPALEACLTDETLEQATAKVNRAIEAHELDQATKVLRNTLLRLKPKLRAFGLAVTSVHRYGYQLVTAR